MLIRKLLDCEEFIAGDGTLLREVLHPDKQAVALRYSLAHAIVPVGQTSIPHALATSEVYYLLSGEGEMHIQPESSELEVQSVSAGDLVYIPPHAKQWIRNCGPEPLVFLCIVDPAWQVADETVFAD